LPNKINLILGKFEIRYEPYTFFQTRKHSILSTKWILPKIQIKPESKLQIHNNSIFSKTNTIDLNESKQQQQQQQH
jgi:hypothetical protein